jgi:hypothetical protein
VYKWSQLDLFDYRLKRVHTISRTQIITDCIFVHIHWSCKTVWRDQAVQSLDQGSKLLHLVNTNLPLFKITPSGFWDFFRMLRKWIPPGKEVRPASTRICRSDTVLSVLLKISWILDKIFCTICSPTGMFALPNLMSHVSSLRDEIQGY